MKNTFRIADKLPKEIFRLEPTPVGDYKMYYEKHSRNNCIGKVLKLGESRYEFLPDQVNLLFDADILRDVADTLDTLAGKKKKPRYRQLKTAIVYFIAGFAFGIFLALTVLKP